MTPPDQMTPAPEGGWESLKVDELKEELDARGLPKSGNKAELVARLADDDVAQKDNLRAPRGETPAEEAAPDDGVAAEEPSAGEVEQAEAPKRRRGSAETSTGTGRRRAAAPRPEDGLIVRARSKYVRSAPRKARLVMDHIRGKEVEQARAILDHAPRAVADDILKLLNSAVANAESAYELGPDELRVRKAIVDEGPTIKRFRPRALGRATKINKRTSHMTIELTTTSRNER
jgi:large subunit ribosomal protein L22